jgi:hypothetical protein
MPALAEPGYLAVLGPAPLRFLPAARQVSHTSAPTATNTPPTAVQPLGGSPAMPGAGNPPTVPPPQIPAETNEVSTPTPPLEPEAVISPQMLIKYFNRSTNGAPTEIIAPMNLGTPHPSEPPSSKATYSN